MDYNFDRIAQLKERKYELLKSKSKREYIQSQIRKQELLINELRVDCDMEQEDVDKLTKMSLTNLFHTILRNKEEQLKLERQQLLAATLKLKEAELSLAELQDQLEQESNNNVELGLIENEIKVLLIAKEAYLRSSSDHAIELDKMEEQILEQRLLMKELNEAIIAGRAVLDALTKASSSLESAENWGNWDLWANGGLLSTHMKHSHIDDARNAIHIANSHLHSFNKELADLNKTVNVQFQTDGLIKMADYWFDGLIVDWVVQGRIKNSQQQTLDALHNIRQIVNKLETEMRVADRALVELEYKKSSWIIDTK